MINPTAGKVDRSVELTREITGLFAKRGQSCAVEVTRYAGHAGELVSQYARQGNPTVFYACGGDGTLGEVAQAVSGFDNCAFAPVPIGTGNDFVKYFGDNAPPCFRSIERLLEGSIETIDLLSVNGRIGLNIASAGLDAAVAQNAARFKRLPFIGGPAAYQLSLAMCFFTSVKNRYRLEVDGVLEEPGNFVFVVAANGRFYGGGFKAAPASDLQDGLIDLITVPTLPHRKMLTMISTYKRGEHLEKYDFIRFSRCKTVRIITQRPIPVNLDGDIFTMDSPVISVLAGAAKVVVPKGCSALKAGREASALSPAYL